MEWKVSKANLPILNSMAKTVCRFKMQIGRYGRAVLTVKIEDPMVQDSSLSKQIKK